MAVIVATKTSTQAGGIGLDQNMNITKPASTADGDILLLHMVWEGVADPSSTAGWTLLDTGTIGTHSKSAVYWKVAASEAASYSFTFAGLGGSSAVQIELMRITGHDRILLIDQHTVKVNGSSTTATATGATPTRANSLILLLFGMPSAICTSSAYALATSSPSFTEEYDSTQSGGGAGASSFSGASGNRPEVTATGNGTATLSGAAASAGHLIIVAPAIDQAPAAPLYLVNATLFMFPFNTPLFRVFVNFLGKRGTGANEGKHSSEWENETKS